MSRLVHRGQNDRESTVRDGSAANRRRRGPGLASGSRMGFVAWTRWVGLVTLSAAFSVTLSFTLSVAMSAAVSPAVSVTAEWTAAQERVADLGSTVGGDSTVGVARVAVPAADLPPGASVVRLQDQAGRVYLAQTGGAWLSDPQPNGDAAAPVWLTFLVPLPPLGSDPTPLQLRLLAAEDAADPSPRLVWVDASVARAGVDSALTFGRELRWRDRPVLRLMSPVYDDATPERRDETYKVFHHLWMPGLPDPITKGSGGLFPHHRGLFMGWNRIRLTQAGQTSEVDTWHAKLAHQELDRERVREAGPIFGRQVLEILWVNESVQPARPFLRETRELIVVPIGQQRLVQFNARLESLTGDIVLAGDPQHAGFQFRASQHVAEVSKDQTYYLRPDGIDRPGNFRNWPDQPEHVALPFQGMSFMIDDQRLTCVRLEHPSNPGTARFSERDYGRFGSYFEHTLAADQPLHVSYQLRVVPGEVSVATADQWQRLFAAPAAVDWLGRGEAEGTDDHSPTTSRGGSRPDPWLALSRGLHRLNREPLNQEPLFAGAAGQWDAAIRERGWILHDDDDQYKLWYTGYDGQRSSTKYLGLATSPDGLQWTRSPANPLLTEHWVEDVMVVKHEQVYWMFAEGRDDIAHWFRSLDGERWERMGEMDIRKTDGTPIEAGPRGTPTVWRDDERWCLLYERKDAGIWLATSADLRVWTHVQDEPVMGLADRSYDQTMIAVNQVLPTAGGYLCLFHSSSDLEPPRRWVCSAAVSHNLRDWTKLPEPLTPPDRNQSSGILVAIPQGWRFYTMHPHVDAYHLE